MISLYFKLSTCVLHASPILCKFNYSNIIWCKVIIFLHLIGAGTSLPDPPCYVLGQLLLPNMPSTYDITSTVAFIFLKVEKFLMMSSRIRKTFHSHAWPTSISLNHYLPNHGLL
jgi:hypothetical protein